jgi:peptide/nickel transport system permease protein
LAVTEASPALRRNPILGELGSWSLSLKCGAAITLVIVLAAIFAPWIAPYDPNAQDFEALLMPPGWPHLFGTDSLGRDIFSRVLYGARIDLVIGFFTTYVPMTYGVILGAYAGYKGGWFDAVLMRIIDVAMAFPFLVLIIVILAILGPGIQNIYISVFILAWTMYARLARAEMLVERTKDYMTAVEVLGFPQRRIILRHGLPNVINSSIVFSASDFVLNILLVSGLSFLGLGVQPPLPEWGAMISSGRQYLLEQWWVATMPGIAIFAVSLGFNLLGDGLRDVLDPKQASAR